MNLQKLIFLTITFFIASCGNSQNKEKEGELIWHELLSAVDASTQEPFKPNRKIFECRRVVADDLIFYYQLSQDDTQSEDNDKIDAQLIIWRYYIYKNQIGTPIIDQLKLDLNISASNNSLQYEILASADTEKRYPTEPVTHKSNSASVISDFLEVKKGDLLFSLSSDQNIHNINVKRGLIGFTKQEFEQDINLECR